MIGCNDLIQAAGKVIIAINLVAIHQFILLFREITITVEEYFDDDGQHDDHPQQAEDEQFDDDFTASQVVDACFAEVNVANSDHITAPWYLDSGASHHVSGDSVVFSSLAASSGTKITSAGGHAHDVTGMGNVAIRFPTGEIHKVTHILYSPGITKNLLSVGFLAEKGFSLEFKSHACYIRDSIGKVIAVAERNPRNGLYQLHGETITHCSEVLSCTTSHSPLVMKWHKRLGHFHVQGIRRMIQARLVTGLSKMTLSDVSGETYMRGKQSRKPILKIKTTTTSQVLELVHTDICGSFHVKSLGGAQYFISFIDDFSRKTFVYFIHTKNEALEKFQAFHREVERQTKKKLCILRSDNKGEFISIEFTNYCTAHGIHRQLSQPYMPQHNGVAERRN
jgi:hypothetical protein